MEWLTPLRGRRVAIDTSPFIYLIEAHPVYLSVVRPFFAALAGGEITGVTSTVTLLEVLVHPLRHREDELARRYREILLHTANLLVLPLSPGIAEEAAGVRARYYLRTPDAIQVATALHTGASHFLTNDAEIPAVPGLEIVVLDRLLPA